LDLRIGFTLSSYTRRLPTYAGAIARAHSSLPVKIKISETQGSTMSERVITEVFGLSLTAVFVGLLILNAISF
jgi:hypothetical protein